MNSWHFNRLKTMSIAEVLFRTKRYLSDFISERNNVRMNLTLNEFITGSKIFDVHPRDLEIRSHTVDIFGTRFNFGDQPIDWHKDIFSGETFPLVFHSKINILANRNLSAKCVWEINRLQFLPGVCLNYIKTRNRSELELFVRIIKSWSEQNPFLQGINWYSNIEINLRLITWFLCWEILNTEELIAENTEFKEFVEEDWLPLIKKHCIYSYDHPSRYSSSNNHLISEYAGLFIASSKWFFNESGRWNDYSKKGLEKEILRQHSKEGINREEAAEYIQFITDFFLLSYIVGEKVKNPFSKEFKECLHNILSYIYNLLDVKGNFPKYGDDDNGKCYMIDPDEKFNNFRSLLTSGAIIFSDSFLKSKSNGFDLKNEILFGSTGRKLFDSLTECNSHENSKMYSNDGHFILRKKSGKNEIFLHFDSAPLGFLSIAAHGHADALSFALNVDGTQVFVDSGTFTYHTDPEWRNYFIGTLSHNTIRINQKDQAENGGPTLWIRHYNTKLIELESDEKTDRVKASHDGYSNEDVCHTREVLFNKVTDEFQITDSIVLTKKKKTEIEIPFHLHPESEIVSSIPNHFIIGCGSGRRVELFIDKGLNPVIIKGQIEPFILGWYSDSFLRKEAAPVIYCKTQIESTAIFQTKIKIN